MKIKTRPLGGLDMHFIFKGTLKESVYSLMRQAGYSFLGKDENTEELSFARPPRGYPRFHLFFRQDGENISFSLHLDQKKPVYRGVTAHSGEYETEIIEKEAEKIKILFKQAM